MDDRMAGFITRINRYVITSNDYNDVTLKFRCNLTRFRRSKTGNGDTDRRANLLRNDFNTRRNRFRIAANTNADIRAHALRERRE